jgi:hypothetical protein
MEECDTRGRGGKNKGWNGRRKEIKEMCRRNGRGGEE